MSDTEIKMHLTVSLSLSACLQSDPQHCHAGNKAGPRQIQHCLGPCTGRNVQQTAGLHGDWVAGHQRIHQWVIETFKFSTMLKSSDAKTVLCIPHFSMASLCSLKTNCLESQDRICRSVSTPPACPRLICIQPSLLVHWASFWSDWLWTSVSDTRLLGRQTHGE